MSMFNDDQMDYMAYLETVDLARLSWCGWYMHGECASFHGGKCATALTCADKCLPCGGSGIIAGKGDVCVACGGAGLKSKESADAVK